ncbi:MAG: GYF domain-containing protein [Verrucomicrobiia bacterium]
MYKILGSDGHEYGPVSAEQVKKWIAENRVEKKTPVIPEGAPDWVFLQSLPEFAAAFGSPPAVQPPASRPPPIPSSARAPKSTDGLNAIIPYKNARALAAYYLGVFSVIPPLGALLGIPALVMGISGLRFRRQNPEAGGSVHAWIGIVLGGLFGFGYLALMALVVIAGIVHRRSMR